MVQHYERMSAAGHGQPASFHGWKHDSTLGNEYEDAELRTADRKTGVVKPGPTRRDGAFVKHAPDVIVVPNTVEYRRALVDKSLWPADQATAQIAGVPFDCTFGDEEELAHHVAKPEPEAPKRARAYSPPTVDVSSTAPDAEKV